jgi:CRP-like cAMP-binding protein
MNSPFEDLTKSQINKLYDLLGVHIYNFNKNQEVLPTIKNGNIVGIIVKGSAQIKNIEYNGNEIIIENLETDSVFGTNISLTNNENYEIIAKEDSQVVVIDYDKLINPNNLNHNYFNIFLMNLFNIINEKLKEKNERIRVLEKKQIRDKLLEYFEIEYKKSYMRRIYLPFSLKDLADYMGVNRSAMFRELKHLKEDNLIEVKKNRITLLYK